MEVFPFFPLNGSGGGPSGGTVRDGPTLVVSVAIFFWGVTRRWRIRRRRTDNVPLLFSSSSLDNPNPPVSRPSAVTSKKHLAEFNDEFF